MPWVFPVAVTVGISRAKALPGFLLPAECGVFPLSFFFESYLEKYPCNLGPQEAHHQINSSTFQLISVLTAQPSLFFSIACGSAVDTAALDSSGNCFLIGDPIIPMFRYIHTVVCSNGNAGLGVT